MIVNRVGPMSLAKIAGALYALIGLFAGGLISLISLMGGPFSRSSGSGFGAMFSIAAVLVMPLIYGGLGFIFSLIAAWLYNVLAGVVGGIEIEVSGG
jgi:hypothetical protein